MPATIAQRRTPTDESAELQTLFAELDKGIDDMEAGRVVPHEKAMKIIRKSVEDYASQYH